MELNARARRFWRDRVRVREEPLHSGDRDLKVFAPRGKYLLVQEGVSRICAERVGTQMVGSERRQDPDQHHVCTDGPRLVLGLVETRSGVALELGENVPCQ